MDWHNATQMNFTKKKSQQSWAKQKQLIEQSNLTELKASECRSSRMLNKKIVQIVFRFVTAWV